MLETSLLRGSTIQTVRILTASLDLNCLKKLEAKVLKMYGVASSTKKSQIKGKSNWKMWQVQLITLRKSLMSTRKREKRKMSKLKCLQECVSFLENKKGESSERWIWFSWCMDSRWKDLIQGRWHFHKVIQTIKSEMDIDINVKDIDRTHWIGAKTENKWRPIIVKFARYSKDAKFSRARRD